MQITMMILRISMAFRAKALLTKREVFTLTLNITWAQVWEENFEAGMQRPEVEVDIFEFE